MKTTSLTVKQFNFQVIQVMKYKTENHNRRERKDTQKTKPTSSNELNYNVKDY